MDRNKTGAIIKTQRDQLHYSEVMIKSAVSRLAQRCVNRCERAIA